MSYSCCMAIECTMHQLAWDPECMYNIQDDWQDIKFGPKFTISTSLKCQFGSGLSSICLALVLEHQQIPNPGFIGYNHQNLD